MSGLLIFHRALWVSTGVLAYFTVCSGFWFVLTANEPTYKAMKFFGTGAIALAFLASWL